MTELTDLSETDSSNTSISGYSTDGSIANMSTTDNVFQAILGMLARSVSEDTLASAGTTDLGSVPGTNVNVTGTTTITAFGTIKAGTVKVVRFSGALTLTYNATSLKLYSKTSLTTYDGLVMTFVSLGSGNWIEVSQTPAVVTFTPVPAFGGLTTGIAGTFNGTMTRHGDKCTVYMYLVFTNKGSATGEFSVGGFVPTAKATPAYWAGSVSQDTNFASLVAGVGAVMNGSQNAIRLRAPVTTGSVALTDVNFTNTTTVAIFLQFEAA